MEEFVKVETKEVSEKFVDCHYYDNGSRLRVMTSEEDYRFNTEKLDKADQDKVTAFVDVCLRLIGIDNDNITKLESNIADLKASAIVEEVPEKTK